MSVHRRGLVLLGGSPMRALRLTMSGRSAIEALRAGEPVPEAARLLGRRLVLAGLAHPRPPARGAPAAVTVVVPVRDDPTRLRRALGSLSGQAHTIVVDDGSKDAAAVADACERLGAQLIRIPHGGPAAARNAGLAAVRTEAVAFLDSDCVAPAGWLEPLAAHLADPTVGAVAPRIVPDFADRAAGTWLARYAASRSPLDMGKRESAVAPATPVSFVPSAALLVRRSALKQPFDERLRYGEDVDLVWRLHDSGWSVRYDPTVEVLHSEPEGWRPLLARRCRYGTAAAPLASRHRRRLAPIAARPMPALAAGALLANRPSLAAALVAVTAVRTAHASRDAGLPAGAAALCAARGTWTTLVGASRAASSVAGPVLLAGLLQPRSRRAAATLLVLSPIEQWARRRPPLDPLRWTLASVADDFAYGLGVWRGCVRERTWTPLLPAMRIDPSSSPISTNSDQISSRHRPIRP